MYFYKIDDNVIASINTLPYDELTPNTTDGAHEKHVPVITRTDNTVTVQVGSVLHPMLEAHYITFVAIETVKDELDYYHVKYLKPGKEPVAVFELTDGEKLVSAYEYCNLHGLWKGTVS